MEENTISNNNSKAVHVKSNSQDKRSVFVSKATVKVTETIEISEEDSSSDELYIACNEYENCVDFFVKSNKKQHSRKKSKTEKMPTEMTITNEKKNLYSCEECSFMAATNKDLTKHYQSNHNDVITFYMCTDCPYRTRKKKLLNTHVGHHKSNRGSKCPKCSFSYPSEHKNQLVRHLKCHKDDYAQQNGKFLKNANEISTSTSDLECPEKQTKSYFISNKKDSSKLESCLSCPLCVFSTTKSRLLFHMKTKHASKPIDTKGLWNCPICKIKTKKLLKHLRVHFKDKNEKKNDKDNEESVIEV